MDRLPPKADEQLALRGISREGAKTLFSVLSASGGERRFVTVIMKMVLSCH